MYNQAIKYEIDFVLMLDISHFQGLHTFEKL